MLEKTLSEFCKEPETLVKNAITADDFVLIKSEVGNAVVISEAEWDILCDALQLTIQRGLK